MGFGGKCLVKESKGMARLQEKLGIPNTILRDILLRNKFLRNNSKSDIVDPYQHSTLIPTVNDIVEKVKDLNV